MKIFKKNKILSKNEEVAEQLRQARQAKKVKLKDVSRELNINYKYLKFLEKGEFAELPAGIYRKNFLREYALYLGLDYKELAKVFTEDSSEKAVSDKDKNFFSKQVIRGYNFLVVSKVVRSIIIVTVVLALFIYLGFCLEKIISPPEVNIIEPRDNLVTSNNSVIVYGLTEPEAQVTINGELVASSNDGVFNKEVNLKDGINTIIIEVKKKYGREIVIERQILVNK